MLTRISRRTYARHPGQTILSVVGIALGVAVVLAIDLTTASAERAFESAVDSVGGRATHEIVGGAGEIEESIYARLRIEQGLRTMAPVVRGEVEAQVENAEQPAGVFTLYGIDPFAEAPLRSYFAFGTRETGSEFDLSEFLMGPGAFAVTERVGRRLGWAVGDRVVVEAQGYRSELELVALLQPSDPVAERGLDRILLTDIATAQEALGKVGRIDRIDVRLDEPARVEAMRARLPAGVELRPLADRRETLGELTRAFSLNLQALSLLTLLVGAFLIFNTVSFTVVRRRRAFGVLRALGATRSQVFRMVLLEAVLLGAVGTGLGIALGYGLAHGLLGIVTRTIEDHYFTVSVSSVPFSGADLAFAAALGFAVCVVAALAPAWDATRVPPREVLLQTPLETKWRRWTARGLVLAIALVGVGAVVLSTSVGLTAAYTGLFTILFGAACITPAVCRVVAGAVRPLCRVILGTLGVHAARSATSSLSRTAVATAALMLAVATTVGLGSMISSFRGTVDRWLQFTLVADVFVSPPVSVAERFRVRIDPEVSARIPEVEGVARAAAYRRFEVAGRAGGTDLPVVQCVSILGFEHVADVFEPVQGERAEILERALEGATVLVSEPFAHKHGLVVGDRFELRTPRGLEPFEIGGVFYDYASERGFVVVPRPLFEQHFDPIGISAYALFADVGVDPDELASRVEAAGGITQRLTARSSRGLREASLEVFDRTFQVTAALRLLCVVVAFLGIWSALSSLQLERKQEVGVLRAIGATRRQVVTWITTRTTILGLAAGLFALPVGAAVGWILVHVINRRSFGWSLLSFDVPIAVMVEALVLATAASLLASVPLAMRFARAKVPEALRES